MPYQGPPLGMLAFPHLFTSLSKATLPCSFLIPTFICLNIQYYVTLYPPYLLVRTENYKLASQTTVCTSIVRLLYLFRFRIPQQAKIKVGARYKIVLKRNMLNTLKGDNSNICLAIIVYLIP